MMTTDKPGLLDPQIVTFKDAMSTLVIDLANTCNDIGLATAAWGTATAETVNKTHRHGVSNAARLPDEVSRAVIQVAGGDLHLIGQLLTYSFTAPTLVGPLARSAVENAALILTLNRETDSPEVRTYRAARALRDGIKNDETHNAHPGVDKLRKELTQLTTRYTNKHTVEENKEFGEGTRALVREELGELVGNDLYDELCNVTHYNAWTAFFQHLVADVKPIVMELDSLRYAYRTGLAVVGSGFVLLRYRDEQATTGIREQLNTYTTRLLQLGNAVDAYQDELRKQTS
ncbi:hypothetical protein ACUY28_07570 [Corynebacterium sanguinis]|uniref:Uncharacterized protein n=1 Tax=Corynebacterium sanguinis TaxID=2594913 RepID=A0A838WVT3_9CORY|nr:hypothetical protein [Corynebacterium sanguinis]MBA4504738.1 hypothetical protein [Corynebacterium sanguinis]